MTSRLETIVRSVHAELQFPVAVSFSIGRLEGGKHHSPPHVAWVPVGGPFNPPKHKGGRLVPGTTGPVVPPNGDLQQVGADTFQNACASRSLNVVAVIWANDLGETADGVDPGLEGTEELLHQVAAAAHRAGGEVVFDREQWVNQAEQLASWGIDGQAVTLTMRWSVPVIHEVAPVVRFVQQAHTCRLLNTFEDDTPVTP